MTDPTASEIPNHALEPFTVLLGEWTTVGNHPMLPGKTFQGRQQQTIEITKNVKAKDDGKPTFWLMGAHHAREWPSAEIPV